STPLNSVRYTTQQCNMCFMLFILLFIVTLVKRSDEMNVNLWKNDRNFEVEEHEEQRQYYVVEHNDLISKARQDLTARELKIMDFVISKIKPSDTNFTKVNTSMYELTKVLN